jgi:hypothetical protein
VCFAILKIKIILKETWAGSDLSSRVLTEALSSNPNNKKKKKKRKKRKLQEL